MDPADLARARLLLEAREAAYQQALRELAALRFAAARLAALEAFLREAALPASPAEEEAAPLAWLAASSYHALLGAAEARLTALRAAFAPRLAEAEAAVRRAEARRAAAEELLATLRREARRAEGKREGERLAELITQRAHWGE